MKHLCSPYRLKRIDFRNRIVMPAIASFLTEEGGKITDLAVEHYRRRAAGGVNPANMQEPGPSRLRAVRGGAMDGELAECTSFRRRGLDPMEGFGTVGFRIIRWP